MAVSSSTNLTPKSLHHIPPTFHTFLSGLHFWLSVNGSSPTCTSLAFGDWWLHLEGAGAAVLLRLRAPPSVRSAPVNRSVLEGQGLGGLQQ